VCASFHYIHLNTRAGAHYMVVRNISKDLFNGTRVIYHRRVGKCLEVEIATGSSKGKVSFFIIDY